MSTPAITWEDDAPTVPRPPDRKSTAVAPQPKITWDEDKTATSDQSQPSTLLDRAGTLFDQGLGLAKKVIVDPFESMAQTGAETGREAGTAAAVGITHPLTALKAAVDPYSAVPDIAAQTPETEREHPVVTGAARGLGATAGGVGGDIRNAPFFLVGPEGPFIARPILNRLASAGFATLMGKGAVDEAGELGRSWDDPNTTTADKVEGTVRLLTSLGLATKAGYDTAFPHKAGAPPLKGEVLPPETPTPPVRPSNKALPGQPAEQLALPERTQGADPNIAIRTNIPRTEGPGGIEGRPTIALPEAQRELPRREGAPIELGPAPEERESALSIREHTPRVLLAKRGAVAANPNVPRSVFAPKVEGGEDLTVSQRKALIEAEERAQQLPEYLRGFAGERAFGLPERLENQAPESEPVTDVEQPKSDLSEVDRDKIPGGETVDPRSLNVDWDSHPFMLPDDVEHAKERVAKGEELTALVKTDPTTEQKEVVDGHGSLGAALELGVPVRAIEAANIQGEGEAIGARTASHYLAADKPEVSAEIADDPRKQVFGQDAGILASLHDEMRNTPPPPALAVEHRAAPRTEGSPIKWIEDVAHQTMRERMPERVGSVESSARDTNLFKQAKESLGPDASVSDVARKAQELKSPDETIAALHQKNGGATFNLQKGDLNGTDNYAVGAHSDRTLTLDHPPSADEIRTYREKNADLLKRDDRSLGTWNAGDGRHVLDVVATTPDRKEAMRLATEGREPGKEEESIYHLGRGELVPVEKPVTSTSLPRLAVDTRSGREREVEPSYRVRPYEILTERDASGAEKIIARGPKAFEGGPRQRGLFGSQSGAATPDFLNFISSAGLSDVGRKIIDSFRGKEEKTAKGWPEIARFLPAADRDAASKRLQELVTQEINNIGDPRLVEEATKAGSVQRGWYKRTGDLLRFIFGHGANDFIDFFASLSAGKSVERNFIEAFDFWGRWKQAGAPRGVDSGEAVRKLVTELPISGEAGHIAREQLYNKLVNGAEPSGQKMSAFAKNLKGDMQAKTKDRLIKYLFGYTEAERVTKSRGLAMDATMNAIARRLNMLPAEVQESGWSFIRTVLNLSEKEGVSPSEAAHKITEADIRTSSSELVSLIANDPKIRAALDTLAQRTGDDRFSVGRIERSRRFRDALKELGRTRGIGGGLAGADREILARASERAAAARSGTGKGDLAGGVEGEGDTSFETPVEEKIPSLSSKLLEKYGTTADPLKAGFILSDGQMVPLKGEHPAMLAAVQGKEINERTSVGLEDQKSDFINSEGAIRTRYRMSRRGEEVVFSIPDKVTDAQLLQLHAAVQAVGKYGNMVIEQAREGGEHLVKEFPAPRDVDSFLKKVGAYPEEASEKKQGFSVGELPNEPTKKPLLNANPISQIGRAWEDLVGGRVTDGLNSLINSALGKFDLATGIPAKSLLRSKASYLPKDYRKLKQYQVTEPVRAGKEAALNLGTRLSEGLSQRTQQILMDVISGQTDPSQLNIVRSTPRLQDALEATKEARRMLDDLGAQAVMQDRLNDETYFRNVGKYVPRLYRMYEVDYDGLLKKTGEFRPNKADLNRFRQREDIPEEARIAMGEIREAAYPVAKGIRGLTHDINYLKFFKAVANNPEWASETERAGWRQFPITEKLGDLSGKYAHRDIFRDVNDMMTFRSEAGKLLGEMMSKFKRTAVVWKPASFVWHNLSRGFLNWYDLGLSNPITYSRAIFDRAKQGPLYKEALKHGAITEHSGMDPELFESMIDSWNKSSSSNAITRLAEMGAHFMSTVAKGKEFEGKLSDHPYWTAAREFRPLRAATGGASDKIVQAYSALDQVMKMAAFDHLRRTNPEMDPFDAADKARRATVDYSDVPKLVDWGRRTATPFITFPSQAIPKALGSTVRAPWRALILYGLVQAINSNSQKQLGITAEEDEKNRRLSRSKGIEGAGLDQKVFGLPRYVLLPNKDRNGQFQYLDLNHLVHWTGVAQPAAPGITPFGTDRPLGDMELPAEILQRELYGNPLSRMVGPTMFNVDPYTGKKKYGPGEDSSGPLESLAKDTYRTWTPSFVPGNYDFQKMVDSLQERPDYFGRPVPKARAATQFLTGLNIRSTDPATEASFRDREFKAAMEEVQKSLYRTEHDARLSPKERDAKMRELIDRENVLTERYQSIYAPSQR